MQGGEHVIITSQVADLEFLQRVERDHCGFDFANQVGETVHIRWIVQIDDAVLALLHLTSFREGSKMFRVTRAWKGHDWEALNRLHAKGYISNPVGKAKSVMLSKEGKRRAEELFRCLFCD